MTLKREVVIIDGDGAHAGTLSEDDVLTIQKAVALDLSAIVGLQSPMLGGDLLAEFSSADSENSRPETFIPVGDLFMAVIAELQKTNSHIDILQQYIRTLENQVNNHDH